MILNSFVKNFGSKNTITTLQDSNMSSNLKERKVMKKKRTSTSSQQYILNRSSSAQNYSNTNQRSTCHLEPLQLASIQLPCSTFRTPSTVKYGSLQGICQSGFVLNNNEAVKVVGANYQPLSRMQLFQHLTIGRS